MDEIIGELERVKKALGTLSITSTYQNMNSLLACMQMLEGAAQQLQQMAAKKKEE